MKQTFFIVLLMLLCCFSCGAQVSRDSIQYYSTEKAACVGFEKSPARYRDQSGQSFAVVSDPSSNVYYVAYSCRRGYWREPMDKPTIAKAD